MTQHNAFYLRGGRAWPGTNNLGGLLDDGSGQLTGLAKNVQINRADILGKRRGFIRGLDEQFTGPVCGLHRYTDECGIEYLLVADDTGISIRQPFAIPVFEVSDAYPNDGFSGTTTSVDLSRWSDPSLGHRHLRSRLVLRDGVTNPEPLAWFKEATSRSYQVSAPFTFTSDATIESVAFHLKARFANGNGSVRLTIVNNGGQLTAVLAFIDSSGSAFELMNSALVVVGDRAGDVRSFSYDANTRRVRATIFTDGNGNPVVFDETITAVQDADLGQKTLVGLTASAASEFGIEEISSEPI